MASGGYGVKPLTFMNINEAKQAAKSWSKEADKAAGEILGLASEDISPDDSICWGYKRGISDFKAALKEEIEKQIKFYTELTKEAVKGTVRCGINESMITELQNFISLIDQVKPKS